jgi:hypothetical protein
MAYQKYIRETMGDRAHRVYRQEQSTGELTAIPRNKYSFTVSLDTINGPVDLTRIANVQMPSFTYRTQTINKYNDKSIVQTGIDYTPITLTAYDTNDATFEKFLKDYARHYITGPMNDESYTDWLISPKGINLPVTGHYIRKMLITRVDTKTLSNEIEIFHPFITNADADTLDYSDSSPTVFRVAFNYEGYRILSDITPPESTPEIATKQVSNINQVNEFADTSGIYIADNEKELIESSALGTATVTSNKAQLHPIEFNSENGYPSNVRGIDRPYGSEERAARQLEISEVIRTGKVVDRNYPYKAGDKVKLVNYQGKTYMATVPADEINVISDADHAAMPDDLAGLI